MPGGTNSPALKTTLGGENGISDTQVKYHSSVVGWEFAKQQHLLPRQPWCHYQLKALDRRDNSLTPALSHFILTQNARLCKSLAHFSAEETEAAQSHVLLEVT